MKILLINPPTENIIATTQPPFIVAEKGAYPPLGLLSIATVIKKTPHSVKIIDCQLNKMGYSELKQKIIEYNPDIVGITLITFMLLDGLKTSALVKESELALNKKIIVIGGGPHATIFPNETIAKDSFDYIFSGEAEHSIVLFLNNLGNFDQLKNIAGIFFKDGTNTIKGPPNSYIDDLNSLPIPDRRLLDYQRYRNLLSSKRLMTTAITSRGCPYQCIFCNRLGKKFRATSAEYVIREIEDCLSLGINEIFFHDDTFTVDHQRVNEICRQIIAKKLKLKFSLRARVDTIDETMVSSLKKAGCQRISFGVESGVTRIIKRIKKGITLEQVVNAFYLTKKYKITTLADFMIGHPSEKVEDVYSTLNFAKKLNPDYAQFSITTPYPATQLYCQALEQGVIDHDLWREFAINPSKDFHVPRWEVDINRDELKILLNKCYRQFYLRPSFAIKTLLSIRSADELKRKTKAGLSLVKNTIGRKNQ
ncbi:MAG: radical SAM protein [Candidatus Omnitrophica bacterium]|nr:radical SAM protein [Candidatus Omnitrophota bacterium]